MGQIKLTTNIIMVALFSLAILVFAINFASDNNSEVSLADDSDFVSIKDNLISEVGSFKDSVNSSSSSFMTTTLEQGDQSGSTGGQFKVSLSNLKDIAVFTAKGSFEKIFGQDTSFGIFFATLSAILIFIAALYAWKSWRGNPD